MSRKMLAIAGAASLALLLIWYFFVFSKQSHSLTKTNAAVAQANNIATGLRSDIAVLQQEKANLPAAQQKLTSLQSALPNTPALDKLIDNINDAANQSGVDWQVLSPAKPATYNATAAASASSLQGGMQAVTVTLEVGGTYQQVLNFVTALNGMPRLLDVTNLQLSGVNGTKTTAQLTTQIFFVPPTAGSTTASATTP